MRALPAGRSAIAWLHGWPPAFATLATDKTPPAPPATA
jgi:hypothetical protein